MLRNTAREKNIKTLRDMIETHLVEAKQTFELQGLEVQLGTNFEMTSDSSSRPPEIWIQIYRDRDGDRPQHACGVSYTCDNDEISAQTTEGVRNNRTPKSAYECGVNQNQCKQLVEKTIRECLELL